MSKSTKQGIFAIKRKKLTWETLAYIDDYHTIFGRFCIECINLSSCFIKQLQAAIRTMNKVGEQMSNDLLKR